MTTAKPTKQTPAQELLSIAQREAKRCKSWIELSNAIYGIGSPFSRLFPEQTQRTAFAGSDEHKEISALIESMPEAEGETDFSAFSTASGKLLLRMPISLHAALIKEAEHEGVSVNQLIVAKLSAQLASVVSAR